MQFKHTIGHIVAVPDGVEPPKGAVSIPKGIKMKASDLMKATKEVSRLVSLNPALCFLHLKDTGRSIHPVMRTLQARRTGKAVAVAIDKSDQMKVWSHITACSAFRRLHSSPCMHRASGASKELHAYTSYRGCMQRVRSSRTIKIGEVEIFP